VTAALLVHWLDGDRAGWERIRRWHALGAAIVIVAAAMYAKKNDAAQSGIAILLLLGLVALAAVSASGLVRDGAMAVFALSLAAILIFTGAVAALYRPMSSKYSARRMVLSVARDRNIPARTVAFAFAEPYSGDFYGRMRLPGGVDHFPLNSGDEALRRMWERPGTAVIFPASDWWRLSPEFKTLVTVTHFGGRWMAIRSRLFPGRFAPGMVPYGFAPVGRP